ncbi:uncharacterized protein MONBRDRAFT_23351 [Monosiga brevicollis MX1]|uniref:tRNA N(3)-methylcytidine methyltransferase n=1 Tax=Monosiga brevicollis TaxID=81824 RepID=A9UT49_MONBE|nr:uncharacterized protein MONBRDRAFT_23351 [Monosiga brevicollis MX1]EDQ91183.1 predicted protein [Monosiga brevicollis MX1]|eukprot:XP_001743605.1 hypothetical protein [Monosiga brevicollis MX1]
MAQEAPLREFLVQKCDREQQRHWDLFYKRNTTNFFKDRNWLLREFPELMLQAVPEAKAEQGEKATASRPVLFELGCGVGNTIFPLRRENPNLFVHACDLSPRAVEHVKQHEEYDPANVHAFHCNLATDNVLDHVPAGSCHLITAFFVFSALSLEQMGTVIDSLAKIMAPGGKVCFRDYAIFDHAMIRFKKGHKLGDRFYMRQDGTRTYFLRQDEARQLFESRGFKSDRVGYVRRDTVNVKESIDVARCFLQGVFVY